MAGCHTCCILVQGQLTEATAQRLFLQLLTALEFRRTMGASQDFLVDDVLLATSPLAGDGADGLPTIKTCETLTLPRLYFQHARTHMGGLVTPAQGSASSSRRACHAASLLPAEFGLD